MFSENERSQLRERIIEIAKGDSRVSGGGSNGPPILGSWTENPYYLPYPQFVHSRLGKIVPLHFGGRETFCLIGPRPFKHVVLGHESTVHLQWHMRCYNVESRQAHD